VPETPDKITFNFVEDDPPYYLVGDEITHSKTFSSYSMYATGNSAPGYPDYVLDLSRFSDMPEASALRASGWQRAVLIGKLMTSSYESEQKEIEENRTSDKKSMSAEGLNELVRKKIGFTTALFLVQPILEFSEAGLIQAEQLPAQDIPQLVAGTNNSGRRSLRVISADREEQYYDDQYGTKVRDLAAVADDDWEKIEALHRSLYDPLSDEIAIRQPG
jgi:hypothetical protein